MCGRYRSRPFSSRVGAEAHGPLTMALAMGLTAFARARVKWGRGSTRQERRYPFGKTRAPRPWLAIPRVVTLRDPDSGSRGAGHCGVAAGSRVLALGPCFARMCGVREITSYSDSWEKRRGVSLSRPGCCLARPVTGARDVHGESPPHPARNSTSRALPRQRGIPDELGHPLALRSPPGE